jgi:hypothetical protein
VTICIGCCCMQTYSDKEEQPGGRQGKLKWFWTQVLLDNSFNVLYMDTGASLRAALGAWCRRISPVCEVPRVG